MTRIVTAEQFARIFARGVALVPRYGEWLNKAMSEFGIDTEKRQECFLAQVKVESADLTAVSENLNYSADGLANTWPNRYALVKAGGGYVKAEVKTPAGGIAVPVSRYVPNDLALRLAKNPIAIANNVYANRMGNGDEASGDGWRHRGAGFIQATGKTNQLAIAAHFGIPADQIGDWLRTPEGAARSAALFWQQHGLNALADADRFTACCRAVNGGDTGIDARFAAWGITKQVIV